MQDLKDVTRDVHYENYRARHIQQQLVHSQKERKSVITASIASSSLIAIIIIIIIIVVVVISERELAFMFAICYRLSVCVSSVCRL